MHLMHSTCTIVCVTHAYHAFRTIFWQILHRSRVIKYRWYRVIIVSNPKISCNIVWIHKKDIAEGWSLCENWIDSILSLGLHCSLAVGAKYKGIDKESAKTLVGRRALIVAPGAGLSVLYRDISRKQYIASFGSIRKYRDTWRYRDTFTIFLMQDFGQFWPFSGPVNKCNSTI